MSRFGKFINWIIIYSCVCTCNNISKNEFFKDKIHENEFGSVLEWYVCTYI